MNIMDIHTYWSEQAVYSGDRLFDQPPPPPPLPTAAAAAVAAASATAAFLGDPSSSASFGWHGLYEPAATTAVMADHQTQGPYYPYPTAVAAAAGSTRKNYSHEHDPVPFVFNTVTDTYYDSPVESDGGGSGAPSVNTFIVPLPALVQDDDGEEEEEEFVSPGFQQPPTSASVTAMVEADPVSWLPAVEPVLDEYEGQTRTATSTSTSSSTTTTTTMLGGPQSMVLPTLSLDTSSLAFEENRRKESMDIVSPRPQHWPKQTIEMLEVLATLDRAVTEEEEDDNETEDGRRVLGDENVDSPHASLPDPSVAPPLDSLTDFSPWMPTNSMSTTVEMQAVEGSRPIYYYDYSQAVIPPIAHLPSFAFPHPTTTTLTTVTTPSTTTTSSSSMVPSSSARTKRLCQSIKDRRRHLRHSSQPFIVPPVSASIMTGGYQDGNEHSVAPVRRAHPHTQPHPHRYYPPHPLLGPPHQQQQIGRGYGHGHRRIMKTNGSRSVDLSAEMRAFAGEAPPAQEALLLKAKRKEMDQEWNEAFQTYVRAAQAFFQIVQQQQPPTGSSSSPVATRSANGGHHHIHDKPMSSSGGGRGADDASSSERAKAKANGSLALERAQKLKNAYPEKITKPPRDYFSSTEQAAILAGSSRVNGVLYPQWRADCERLEGETQFWSE
ncbi:hypothetical protein FRC17_001984 [Serendipita sp. 399]|nr:hypothetical protein FRC17_001984 [Serendipita sp. 399]